MFIHWHFSKTFVCNKTFRSSSDPG